MASWTYQYKVVGPIVVTDAASFEAALNQWGSQGWELNDADVQGNFLVFQQAILPPGCGALFLLVLNAVLSALGRRKTS